MRLRCLVALLCLTGLLFVTSCAGPSRTDTASGAVERLLDRRAQSVLDRDEAAFLATASAGSAAARSEEFRNLAEMPLSSWEYHLDRLDRTADGATARAELRYRIDGYDRAPVSVARTIELDRHGDDWSVAAERSAADQGDKPVEQLWEQGEVSAIRGQRSLVLGVGRSEEQLRRYAKLADRAVPAVRQVWGHKDWPGRVVILVPGSLDGMAGLLGAPAARYQGIAAVTTGAAGGAQRAPADRVIVNPEAYDVLGDFGKQVVLTHETTHVATRAATTSATPLWLSEGFADWVGYRDSGRTAEQAAPELRRAVLSGQQPGALPKDKDFGFAGDPGRLAQAYESGWMACRMIAERWGEEGLLDFYRAVGEHKQRAGAVHDALREVLGVTAKGFEEEWRGYVRAKLGAK